ncbi:short-chain dehydrogenase [Colletotrichum karsti]|uniref:Short-chain dehydrogenase n=1 Tax=Colletotrichum karsti TaxID=1095194 RepID=A0A9P6I5H7_9PEZI|nr:short-chain dehydrogenase [Colletotrichum karsti]KAF9874356.1 short-chain dehydrogenase [Colletotrichum karsti]
MTQSSSQPNYSITTLSSLLNMSSKRIVFITGANTGIGLETIKFLLQSSKPYHVILGARSAEKGEEAIAQLKKEYSSTQSSLEFLEIDVTSDDAIQSAFDTISKKHGLIDVLVNNAGATFDGFVVSRPDDIASVREAFNKAYDVNTSSAHVMTHVFAPLLLKSSDPRLLFVTSGLSNLNDMAEHGLMPHLGKVTTPAGWPKNPTPMGYRSSKVALNMVMLSWHWLFEEDGVKVWCISPGFLATGLGGNPEVLKKMGAGEPSQGGELIKKVIEGERDADVGKIVGQNGIQTW